MSDTRVAAPRKSLSRDRERALSPNWRYVFRCAHAGVPVRVPLSDYNTWLARSWILFWVPEYPTSALATPALRHQHRVDKVAARALRRVAAAITRNAALGLITLPTPLACCSINHARTDATFRHSRQVPEPLALVAKANIMIPIPPQRGAGRSAEAKSLAEAVQ